MKKIVGDKFRGVTISPYGRQYNRLDYGTLSAKMNMVLNNYIMSETENAGFEWELIGYPETIDEDDLWDAISNSVYQIYIIDKNDAEILIDIGEFVWYCDALDMYLWGVTHFGTNWNYVLTDVPCNVGWEDIEPGEAL